jgi:hypothetical protein
VLHRLGREVGREGAQDELGGWQCWVVHKMRVLSMEYRVSGVGSGPRHDIGVWLFFVRCFRSFSFWASGPLINGASIGTPCPRASVSPCPSKLCFEDRLPWRGFSTLSEALKRLSVRLGAPTACARHWLSQRKTVHQKILILSRKFVLEYNRHGRDRRSRVISRRWGRRQSI